MATGNVELKLSVKLDLEPIHGLLLAAGWTPPGETPDDADHRIDKLKAAHRRELAKVMEDAQNFHTGKMARAAVAEEIAQDLAGQAGGTGATLSASDARFAAHIARRHGKSVFEPIAFWPTGSDYEPVIVEPTRCTLCQHPVPQHGPGGCWAARKGTSRVCDCPATHGRAGPSPEAEDGDGAPKLVACIQVGEMCTTHRQHYSRCAEAAAEVGAPDPNEPTQVFSLRLPPERIRQLRRLTQERYGHGFGVTLMARQILVAELNKAIGTGELAQE